MSENGAAGTTHSLGRDSQPTPATLHGRWLADAATGVVLALALAALLGFALNRFWVRDAQLGMLLSYLVVWVPLLGAVAVACFRHGSRSIVRDFGLRIRGIDLLWGLAIGLFARAVAGLIELAVYGRMGSGSAALGETVYDFWWLFAVILAPVILGPFVEELFFRGLLLRAITRATASHGASSTVATAIAIVVSSLVFALLHVADGGPGDVMLVVGASTLVFGLGAATLATLTGRLGGALVAHAAFNALVVIPALLG